MKETYLERPYQGRIENPEAILEFRDRIRPPADINWIYRQIHKFIKTDQPQLAVADLENRYGIELYRKPANQIIIHIRYEDQYKQS
jgi:hypothetical protein